MYESLHFINPNGSYNQKTVVQYTTELLCEHGLKNINQIQECAGVWIYPKEYFCPLTYENGKTYLTDKTVTIHHYAGSWVPKKQKILRCLVGPKLFMLIYKIRLKFKTD